MLAHHIQNERTHFFILCASALASALLMAIFFYSGSARAVQFPFALALAAAAAYVGAPVIARHMSAVMWPAFTNLIDVSLFALLAYPLALLIAGDFSPHLLWLCVVVGIVCARWRPHTPVAHTALSTIAAVLLGFSFGDFYGVGIVLVSMCASRALDARTHGIDGRLVGLLLVVLFIIFIGSIAHTGRSILFELGDPYVIIGLLASTVVQRYLNTHTITRETIGAALLAPPLLIIIFGKNHGIVLLGALLIGLVIATISSYELERAPHELMPQSAPIFSALVIATALVPIIFR